MQAVVKSFQKSFRCDDRTEYMFWHVQCLEIESCNTFTVNTILNYI
jgi:hypothetical protein